MKIPIVSNMVWFYRKGGGDPISALVTGNGNGRDGILDLTAWGKNALVPSIHSGVRHRDDPWNVSHPDTMRDNGTWAWPDKEAAIKKEPTDDEREVSRIIKEFGSMEAWQVAVNQMLKQKPNYGSLTFKRKPGRPKKDLSRPSTPKSELPVPSAGVPIKVQ